MLRISQAALVVAALALVGPTYAQDEMSSAAPAASPLAAAGAAAGTGDTTATTSDDDEASAVDDTEDASAADDTDEASAVDDTEDASAADDTEDASAVDDTDDASAVDDASDASAMDDTDDASDASAADSSSPAITAPAGVSMSLTIPTVTAVQSSMDEAAIRDALTGGFSKHVQELATLNAASITIPEITFHSTMTAPDGKSIVTDATYRDIVLTGVHSGIAATVKVGSTESRNDETKISLGAMTAENYDIGGTLGFYSLVENGGADQPLKPIFTNLKFDGGTLTTKQGNCTIGAITEARFEARPLKVSFPNFIDAMNTLGKSEANPPPEAIRTTATFFADLFQAIRSEPVKLDGMSCSGTGDDGKPFSLSVGTIAVDGYQPGIYPGIHIADLKVGDGGQNVVSLGKFDFKPTDLSSTIAVITDPAAQYDKGWFEANARRLIPSFGGLSLSNLAVDVDDPESPGTRIQASVDDFDLTLADYINGIPSKLSTSSHGIHFPLPKTSTDQTLAMLSALGMKDLNVGYDFSLGWDKASQTIKLDKFSVSGVNLGSFNLASTFGNALEDLFAVDTNTAIAASTGLTFKDSTLNVADTGLLDLVLPLLAGQQGVDPTTYRTQMAGVAEGFALQLLGSTDDARALGKALGDFISGKAKSVTVDVASKAAAGVPLPLLQSASEDPSKLIPLVNVTGSSQ